MNRSLPTESESRTPVRTLLFMALIAFSVSAATLILQLVQTRIYGVIYWNHLVYFIISIALLGFGISGTWLSFGKESFLGRVLTLPMAAVGFVVATAVAVLVVPQITVSLAGIFDIGQLARLTITYATAVLPYFFAGWMLGMIFRDYVENIHFLYFADLIGAALGCLFFVAAIRPLGAVNLTAITGLLVAVPVLPLAFARRRETVLLVLAVVLAVSHFFFSGIINRTIRPEPTKAFMNLYTNLDEGEEKVWEVSEWNTISRVDAVSTTKRPMPKRIFIDGDAWTGVIRSHKTIPKFPSEGANYTDERAPYFFVKDPDRALIIGTGGGIDVFFALRGGAKRVDAIEINPTTYDLVLDEYRDDSNDLLFQEGVHTYNEEGRSFVRRSDAEYDVIMLHGIDTFAAINSGAYVLSENYLYTVNAIRDYVEHLSPEGVLCINRWLHPAETSRLFVVCMQALAEMGVENPERHIILEGAVTGTVLVRRRPFTDEEITAYSRHVRHSDAHILYPIPGWEGPTGEVHTGDTIQTVTDIAHSYVRATNEGATESFFASLPFDIHPVYDDSPFFFHFDKFGNFTRVLSERGIVDLVRGHWPSFTLMSLLLFTGVAVALFMLLPLTRRPLRNVSHFKAWLVYFTCLGLSFIFVEIALMQRFALLLGHPARSLALVLAGLLFFAGVGSYLASRTWIKPVWAMGLLVAFILLAAFGYPLLVQEVLPWPLWGRSLIALALVAPLGITMGMPFPTGLRHVSEQGAAAVPWMWGVNGGTTVLGSIIAIIIAIWMNFTTVLLAAALGYALALIILLRVQPKP